MTEQILHILKLNLWVGIGVLLVIGVSSLAGKRYSSHWRYAVWMFFALALLIPVRIPGTAQVWELKIPASAQREADAAADADKTPDRVEGQNQMDAAVQDADYNVDTAGETASGEQNQREMQETAEAGQSYVGAPAAQSDLQPAAGEEVKRQPEAEQEGTQRAWHLGIPQIFLAVWAAGIAVGVILRLVIGRAALHRLHRWSRGGIPEEMQQIYRETCRRSGLGKWPALFLNDDAASPVLTGILRPRIYVSEQFYTAEELPLVFEHELYHYRRKDLWYKLLLSTVTLIYWFNPFLYLMKREADKDVEYLVDACVASGKTKEERMRYNRVLLKTAAASCGNRYFLSAGLNDGSSEFKRRILSLMNSGRSRKGIALALAVILAFTAGNLMTGCSVTEQTVQTADKQEEEPPVSPDEEGKIREVTADERINEIDREKLQEMLPLFRAIIELNPEEYGEYENDGPVQVWYKIYHAVVDSVVPDEMGVEYRDGYLSVPESLTAEYGAGLYAGMTELPDIPKECSDRQYPMVLYDAQNRQYLFLASDASEAEVSIAGWTLQEDGSCSVDMKYSYREGTEIRSWQWTMRIVRNTYSSEGQKPMFAYAVCEVISGYESWEIRKEERQQFEDRMEQMTPVFKAMMLKKFNRNPANPGLEGEYFPEYDWYRWDMIRTVCTLASQQEAETGGTVAVDADTVLAYAHALFADTEELPALPADGVTYDAQTDMYLFEPVQQAEVGEIEIHSGKNGFGTYDANVVMTSEGRTTETGCIFELVENTYTAAGDAPQFPYAVKEITYWYEDEI